MRLTRRAISVLVYLIPIAFLAAIGGMLASRYIRASEAHSARILAETLSSALGRELTIGALQFDGADIVAIDVRLAAGPTLRGSGEICSARRIVLNSSVRRLIDEIRGNGPIHADAVIFGARAHVTRSRQGAWNFDDLFRPRPGSKPRAVVARIRFVGASVDYDDAAIPRLLHRDLPPVHAAADHVDGALDLFPDGSVSWIADVARSSTLLQAGHVTGAYESQTGALHVGIDVRDAQSASLARYVIPNQVTVLTGAASGHISVLRTSRRDRTDTSAVLQVDGVSGRIARLNAPLTNVAGSVQLSGTSLYLDLAGHGGNASIHASGVIGLSAPVVLNARYSASIPDLGPILAALAPIHPASLPSWARVSATLSGTLTGPMDALQTESSGTARVSGSPDANVTIQGHAAVRFHIVGPLVAPRVDGSARIERLRYRDTRIRGANLVAAYDGQRWTADLRAQASGGTLSARATLQNDAGSPRYRVVIRARRIDLARAGLQADHRVGGIADADVFLAGTGWTDPPDGQAIVEVRGLSYDKLDLDDARASLRSTGKLLLVDSLVADGASGRVVVSGQVDLRTREADLNVEADRIDLARLPLATNESADTSLAGQVYVREGHVIGPMDDPDFSCAVTAFGPSVGRYRFDYAEVRMQGTQRRFALQDALLWRLPATAHFDGEVLEPLSGHGLIRGSGQFSNLDVQEVARLANANLDAVGEASGDVLIDGLVSAPTVTIDPITVSGAGLGDLTPREVTGALVLRPENRFETTIDVRDVDLFLPNAAISSYAVLDGTADIHAQLAGALRDGEFSGLMGTVTASTHGLTISGQSIGDMSAAATVRDQVLTLRSSADGARPGARLGTAERGIDVTNLQVNLVTGDYMLGAKANGLPIEILRAAIARSPLVSSRSAAAAAQWILPLTEPFAGAIGGSLNLSGNGAPPTGFVQWSGQNLVFDGAAAKRFDGRVEFEGPEVTLREAVLDTGAASVTAAGIYRAGKSVSGNAVVRKLQLERLASLLPDRKALAGLSGIADEARITVDGTPDEPNVHVSATLTDLPILVAAEPVLSKNPGHSMTKSAQQPAVAAQSAPSRALVKRVDIDDAYLSGGKLGVKDIVATLSGAAGASRDYTLSAAGVVDFDRKSNRVPADAHVSATLLLPEQDAGLLIALRPMLKQYFPSLLALDIEGRLSGSLTYSGSLTEWSDPRKALASGSILPDLRGDFTLLATRVRYGEMRTILTDVDASVRFTGDRLVVGRNPVTDRPFTATMAVLDPKTGKQDPTRPSDPIELSGELPLRPDLPNVSPLRLTAHRLVFAESVLPYFGSGSAAGEISAPLPTGHKTTTDPGLALTFENTLLQPRISGTVHLRKTAIRLPNALDEAPVQTPANLLQPSFANVRFQVDDQVRIATSALALEVQTPPQQPIVLSGDIERPRLEGVLAVNRGVLAFPTARFNISKGGRVEVRYPAYANVTLDRPGQSLDDSSLGIIVDLTAVGHLTAASATTGRSRRYTITVEAQGPINSEQPIDLTDSELRGAADSQRSLRLTFRSDPADLALTSAGLQRKITGALGGQDAIEGLFRSDPRLARLFGDQVIGMVSANLLPSLFDRVGLTEALGLQELSLDYNQLEQFSIRLSRNLAGPFDVSFWHRFGATQLNTTSEAGVWEAKLSYRLWRGAQLSWTTDDQRTNAYLLEGVYRF